MAEGSCASLKSRHKDRIRNTRNVSGERSGKEKKREPDEAGRAVQQPHRSNLRERRNKRRNTMGTCGRCSTVLHKVRPGCMSDDLALTWNDHCHAPPLSVGRMWEAWPWQKHSDRFQRAVGGASSSLWSEI